MKTTRKLIIYLLVVHLAILLLVWMADFPAWAIICSEILVIISAVLGIRWADRMDKQQQIITSSIENLKSQDLTLQLKETGNEEFDTLVGLYNSMIENLRSERVATNELNYFLASIIRASPSGIVLFDYDNLIKSVNPAAENLLGTEEKALLGKGRDELPGEIADVLYYDRPEWNVVKRDVNNIIRVYGGRFINRGFETRFVLFEDFSKEIYAAEKASYDTIVRMMGHEVNNTTGAVNSVLDTYIDRHDDTFSRTFKIIRERNDNLGSFMKKLSDIVRLPDPDLMEFDLAPVIRQVMVLVKARFNDRSITWALNPPEGSFTVRADQAQMEQALINILTNAAEAISEEGRVEVEYDEKNKTLFVRNDGEPLTEEQQQKAFTSFFTTKEKGKGIGLMLTREILDRHGCRFYLKKIEDGRTEFGVRFQPLPNI